MNAADNPVPVCTLAAAAAAAVAACDAIDGVKDGVIEDPKRCTYAPKVLVGTSAGECGTFTEADAVVIRKIWEGPRRPDLSAFRASGGKALVWHGWADQLITPEGTINYYTRVQREMGGAKAASEFIRPFLAPGVGHCAGGAGPAPTRQLEALLSWVEDGKAPEALMAERRDASGAVTRSRTRCQYPLVAKYKGTGSTDVASNFVCSAGF